MLVTDEWYEEAEPLLREGLKIENDGLPAGSARAAQTAIRLGVCLTGLGRFAEAETLLLAGYQALREKRGVGHADTQEALGQVIELYVKWDKPDEAARWRATKSPDALEANRSASGGE